VGRSRLGKLLDQARELILPASGIRVRGVPLQCGEATRVAEQLPNGDATRRAPREVLKNLGDLSVQLELAGLDQLHHRQRREALRDRTDHEWRVRRDLRIASGPDHAARAHLRDLATVHDGVGESGHPRGRHLRIDNRLHRIVRLTRWEGGTEPERKDGQQSHRHGRLPGFVDVSTVVGP